MIRMPWPRFIGLLVLVCGLAAVGGWLLPTSFIFILVFAAFLVVVLVWSKDDVEASDEKN